MPIEKDDFGQFRHDYANRISFSIEVDRRGPQRVMRVETDLVLYPEQPGYSDDEVAYLIEDINDFLKAHEEHVDKAVIICTWQPRRASR